MELKKIIPQILQIKVQSFVNIHKYLLLAYMTSFTIQQTFHDCVNHHQRTSWWKVRIDGWKPVNASWLEVKVSKQDAVKLMPYW